MVEDSSSEGSLKKRSALADVTNRHGKRGFLSISNNSTVKIGSGCIENVENRERNLEISKKLCHGRENLLQTKSISEVLEDVSKKDSQLSKSKRLCGSEKPGVVGQVPRANTVSGILKIPNEIRGNQIFFPSDEAVRQEVLEKGDASKLSGTSSISMLVGDGKCKKDEILKHVGDGKWKKDEISKHTGDGECSKDENSSSSATISVKEKWEDDKEVVYPDVGTEVIELDSSDEELATNVVEGTDGDDVTSKKSSSSLCLEPSASSSSKFSESERCTGFTGDGGADSCPGLDMLKACSCSFCLKAAHIWSDLHYQDAKGRIAALKKSRKDIRSLVEKSTIPADFANYCQGNPNKSVKLEVDLMNRWRSLFLHTEDILLSESTQLQSSLFALKELRENCKADLETITGDPTNKK